MSKLIPLSKGRFAVVDDADYDALMQDKWYSSGGYALRSAKKPPAGMHRVLLHCLPTFVVDHINHRRSDNRRKNLRAVTQSDNRYNAGTTNPGNHWRVYRSVSRGLTPEEWVFIDKEIETMMAFHENQMLLIELALDNEPINNLETINGVSPDYRYTMPPFEELPA